MSNDKYIEKLSEQDRNTQRPANLVYLTDLYSRVEIQFSKNAKLLEIGAGAGTSRHFMKSQSVIRTDILPWKDAEVLGGIDAGALPYPDDHFDGAFAIDVLHHLQYPLQVLAELKRVVRPNGKIVLIEPYVSALSYLVYKVFHDEKTSIRINFDPSVPSVGQNPADGDQYLGQSVFMTRRGRSALKAAGLLENGNLEVDLFHPLSFFSTGGLSNPLPTPSGLIYFLLKVEGLLPRIIRRLVAARSRYVLTVKN